MRPILEYASTVLDGFNENDKHSLEKLQNEAALLSQALLDRYL
jgi:hypothetical protein